MIEAFAGRQRPILQTICQVAKECRPSVTQVSQIWVLISVCSRSSISHRSVQDGRGGLLNGGMTSQEYRGIEMIKGYSSEAAQLLLRRHSAHSQSSTISRAFRSIAVLEALPES